MLTKSLYPSSVFSTYTASSKSFASEPSIVIISRCRKSFRFFSSSEKSSSILSSSCKTSFGNFSSIPSFKSNDEISASVSLGLPRTLTISPSGFLSSSPQKSTFTATKSPVFAPFINFFGI